MWRAGAGINPRNNCTKTTSTSTKIPLSLLDLPAEVLPEISFLLKEVKEQNKNLHSYSSSETYRHINLMLGKFEYISF